MASESGVIYLSDNVTAARVASLFSAIAALWCFVSQWAYYGVSSMPHAWNGWIVGAIMFIFAAVRVYRPWLAPGLSLTNSVLAVWIFLSPWIFGYTDNMAEWINSLAIGVVIFALSLLSARITKQHLTPLYRI